VDESSSQQFFHLDSLVTDDHSFSRIDEVVISRPSLAEYFSRLKNLQIDLCYKDVNRTLYDWDIVTSTSQTLTRLDIRVEGVSHLDLVLQTIVY
jgi:hypothetical protein